MIDLISPLNQSEAFERTCASLGLNTRRVSSAHGSCLVQTRRLPVIGNFHLISRGPVMRDAGAQEELISELRSALKGTLVINAAAHAKSIGGIKIAGGAELAIMDLLDPDAMRARLNQKWRNQLNKAERARLTITDQPLDATRHQWFLEAEQAQQKMRKYKSYPARFLLAFAAANKGQARLYTAAENGNPVAAILVLKHGRMATYQAGVTTDLGRQYCSHNQLLWRVMSDLQRRGFAQLDLGRADLYPGLRRFKLAAGASLVRLPGSFISHSLFSGRSSNQASLEALSRRVA